MNKSTLGVITPLGQSDLSEINDIVSRLCSDWDFIAKFLDNPYQALEGFRLTEDERRALLARTPDALLRVGIDSKAALAAMSGGHSAGCNTTRIVP